MSNTTRDRRGRRALRHKLLARGTHRAARLHRLQERQLTEKVIEAISGTRRHASMSQVRS
jgi:hypothetical protein